MGTQKERNNYLFVMKELRNLKIPSTGITSKIVIRINNNILSFDFNLSNKINEIIIFNIYKPVRTLNKLHSILKIYSVGCGHKYMYHIKHEWIKNVYNCIDLLLQIHMCNVMIRK